MWKLAKVVALLISGAAVLMIENTPAGIRDNICSWGVLANCPDWLQSEIVASVLKGSLWLLFVCFILSLIFPFIMDDYRETKSFIESLPTQSKAEQAGSGSLRASDLIGAWTAIFNYILPHCRPNDPDNKALTRAQDAFITAAFDEEIDVWGQLRGSGDVTKIGKWFWRNAMIDPIDSMRDGDKAVFLTDAPAVSDEQTNISKYVDCEVNKHQIEQKWPLVSSTVSTGPALLTWFELEQRFRDLESPMQYMRIDGQTGAAGEYWRVAGAPTGDAEKRFNAVAVMASNRLFQDFPIEVSRYPDLRSENDPVIRWYKALRFIGGRYEADRYAEQVNEDGSSGGFIFTGSIEQPAMASATLCLELASRPTDKA